MQAGRGRMFQRWGEDFGWRGRVGFITPPHFSITSTEFMGIAPEGIAVNEAKTFVPGKDGLPIKFILTVEHLKEAVKQVEHCAMVLKAAGVDVICQAGTPFAFAPEGGLAFAKELHARIEKNTGIPVVFQGLSIINALHWLGHKSIAVAATYYSDVLVVKYKKYLEDAGFKVLGMENFTSQGIFSNQDEVQRNLTHRYYMSQAYDAAKMVANHHPDADCVVISGGGITTLDILEALEWDLKRQVISNGATTFWEIFCKLGIHEPIKGRGSLLASLDKSP